MKSWASTDQREQVRKSPAQGTHRRGAAILSGRPHTFEVRLAVPLLVENPSSDPSATHPQTGFALSALQHALKASTSCQVRRIPERILGKYVQAIIPRKGENLSRFFCRSGKAGRAGSWRFLKNDPRAIQTRPRVAELSLSRVPESICARMLGQEHPRQRGRLTGSRWERI